MITVFMEVAADADWESSPDTMWRVLRAAIFDIEQPSATEWVVTTTYDYDALRCASFADRDDHDLHLRRLWHAECVKARMTGGTVQVMLVQILIERDQATTRFAVTGQGRAVLSRLLDRAGIDMPQN